MRQNTTDNTLTPAQDNALAALLAGKTVMDAAAAAGVQQSYEPPCNPAS